MQPIRSARIRTCAADSSPVMISAGAAVRRGPSVRGGQQESRFADTRLSGQQHDASRHQTPTQDTIQLGNTAGLRRDLTRVDLTDRPCRCGDRPRRDLAEHGLHGAHLRQAAPGLAIRTAPCPLRHRCAAFRAMESRFRSFQRPGRRSGTGTRCERRSGSGSMIRCALREGRVSGHDSNASSSHRQ